MTSIKLHELIDKDIPKCLYCDSDVSVELSSEWIPHTFLRADLEILTCTKCKEQFSIISLQGDSGVTEYTGFIFSCKKFRVFFNYIEDYFDISDKKGKHITAIPSFEVDFSDKKKLHKKLKTYVLFS